VDIPDNLARLDKRPAFRNDPASVARLGFEVLDRAGNRLHPADIDLTPYSRSDFPFRLRQRPGPGNALGQVEFMFPNRNDVSLHGTPTHDLFSRVGRALSSGCVRVADASDQAGWVLEDSPGWSDQRLGEVIASGRETRVDLAVKVPIHILYFNAVANPDGSLRRVHDGYGRDARLIAALGRSPRGYE
jgi:murein L,D-transpeptidase YcbB/YkuD